MARVRGIACRTAANYLEQIGGPLVRREVGGEVRHDAYFEGVNREPRHRQACCLQLSVGKITPEKRVELLFEVGCEEIPAGMLPKAEKS